MAPPQQPFQPRVLIEKVQLDMQLKKRKDIIDLQHCALKQLLQYDCGLEYEKPEDEYPTVVCRPVARLFRMCKDGVSVETTAWETAEGAKK